MTKVVSPETGELWLTRMVSWQARSWWEHLPASGPPNISVEHRQVKRSAVSVEDETVGTVPESSSVLSELVHKEGMYGYSTRLSEITVLQRAPLRVLLRIKPSSSNLAAASSNGQPAGSVLARQINVALPVSVGTG